MRTTSRSTRSRPPATPMRMIKASRASATASALTGEAYGYLLDGNGKCAYITSYYREARRHPARGTSR